MTTLEVVVRNPTDILEISDALKPLGLNVLVQQGKTKTTRRGKKLRKFFISSRADLSNRTERVREAIEDNAHVSIKAINEVGQRLRA